MSYTTRILAGMLLAVLVPATAVGAQLRWTFDNDHSGQISLEFFSSDRDHVWPGNNQVWIVDRDAGDQSFLLECLPGEEICFGAWDRRDPQAAFWGLGPNGQYDSCQTGNCCGICGAGDMEGLILY